MILEYDQIKQKNILKSTITANNPDNSEQLNISASGTISKTVNNVTTTYDLPAESGTLARKEETLPNKTYAPAEFSGLGRKYLQKNIVDVSGTDKNVLTQAMVSDANTIYVIQYDYDLNGQSITIPSGCTLLFEGGSIKNGTIVGNSTTIEAAQECIFDSITFSGTFITKAIYPEWFAGNSDSAHIQAAVDAAQVIMGIIVLSEKVYNITETININNRVRIQGAQNTQLKTTLAIPIIEGNLTYTSIRDVYFVGNESSIVTDSYGIKMTGGYVVELHNCRFYKLDIGMRLGGVQITIDNCYFNNNNYGAVSYKKANISTCVNFLNCTFTENVEYAFCDNKYPSENTTEAHTLNVGLVNKLAFDNTIFELNGHAFAIRYSRYTAVRNCWFERNTNASPYVRYLFFFYNCPSFSDAGFTNFELDPNAYGYGHGSCTVINSSGVRSNKFLFSYYGDNYKAIDNGKLTLEEGAINNVRHLFNQHDSISRDYVLRTSETIASNYFPTVDAFAFVKSDGTVGKKASLFDSIYYSDESTAYVVKLRGNIYNCSVVVTPYAYDKYLTAYIQKKSTTNYAGGVSGDYCNYIQIRFYEVGSTTQVKPAFGIMVTYSRES